MTNYIWQDEQWPRFIYNIKAFKPYLATLAYNFNIAQDLYSRVSPIPKHQMLVDTISNEIVYSLKLDGEDISMEKTKDSVTRYLKFDDVKLYSEEQDTHIDYIVASFLNALSNKDLNNTLTSYTILSAHHDLQGVGVTYKEGLVEYSPSVYRSEQYHNDKTDFDAPSCDTIEKEMNAFLYYFTNMLNDSKENLYIKSAIFHLHFDTIHPFIKNNSRVTRFISLIPFTIIPFGQEKISLCYMFSISKILYEHKEEYFAKLSEAQKGDLNITSWISWYLDIFNKAVIEMVEDITFYFRLTALNEKIHNLDKPINERQINAIFSLFYEKEDKLSYKEYASLFSCDEETARFELSMLEGNGLLQKTIDNEGNFYYVVEDKPTYYITPEEIASPHN